MTSFDELIRQGAANAWLFVPTALALGALHGLEPGHSKALMASYIVAIRGTAAQAVLLGLCAALSHSLVVWLIAALALTWGDALVAEQAEPYLQIVSGIIVVALALTMFRALHRSADHDHGHDHGHDHAHDHGAGRRSGQTVTTGQIAVFGLTGGLLPCPAAITVLLICLQIKQFTLGAGMVAAFSAGLAVTLVAVGVAAAWSVGQAARRISRFQLWAHRLPYISTTLVTLLGLIMLASGVAKLA